LHTPTGKDRAMAQICSKCSLANPPDATYCYHDGALLEGHTAQRGGPTRGSQPFPSQFVFPSGQVCGNFDQLATACQNNWAEAVDLLRQGYLASFLGGLGRVDLAVAAQEAARFPDADRGLDQLLAKLPSQVLEPPRLKAEPADVSLGVVPMGADRHFELHLTNLGGRLLYGAVVSDSKWLTLGEAPGNSQKLVQFRDEAGVPVQVRGQHLRAGNKPLEGQLLLDSNGGQVTVRVRVDVPVRPFPRGVLAGAATPREVAVKAKQAAKDKQTAREAAALFEDGSVAQWYKDNGWTYPVQAPTASGLGAVQQFFEALGLASAPKVEVAEKSVELQGAVGASLQHTLEVRTPEKRPVWAWGTSDQPWLDVGRAQLNGRVALLPLIVRHVPDRAGETLQATVNVTANGNQRFAVPVTLAVAPGSPFTFSDQAVPVAALPVEAVPVAAVPVEPVLAEPVAAVPADPAAPFAAFALGAAPTTVAVPAALTMQRSAARAARQGRLPAWVHLLPAGLLVLALLVTIVKDLFSPAAAPEVVLDPQPRIAVAFDYPKLSGPAANPGTTLTFGLVMVDPSRPDEAHPKRLTFDPTGLTNSTVVRIDGKDFVFGRDGGQWEPPPKEVGKWGGARATWVFNEGAVAVTQTVKLVPGEPQIVGGEYKRLIDTCLVRYDVKNKDRKAHKVALRVVLDTFIGNNDGVPFTVPGQSELVNNMADYRGAQVPDFVQVLEYPDLRNPGTVAQVNLRVGGNLEPPGRVSLTHWPERNKGLYTFEVPVVSMAGTRLEKEQGWDGDSAVVAYWEEKELGPKEVRGLGFTYGLGSLASGGTGQLAITVGGALVVNNELTVVGLVAEPRPGETLALELPEGLSLAGGEARQAVPPRQAGAGNRPSPVTWRVQARQTGTFVITIRSSTGAVQERRITITGQSIF
jgi:hypothetical protein